MTEPSADMATAAPPGKPGSSIPAPAVQRNTSGSGAVSVSPSTTDPSGEMAVGMLRSALPGAGKSGAVPVSRVQRNGSSPEKGSASPAGLKLVPTTTAPS